MACTACEMQCDTAYMQALRDATIMGQAPAERTKDGPIV